MNECKQIGKLTGGYWDAFDSISRVYSPDGLSPTLNTCQGGGRQVKIYQSGVRKLTPREYWRLMGFDDDDFDKVRPILSDTQLYKLAGNSIVVNVLESIFKQLLLGG